MERFFSFIPEKRMRLFLQIVKGALSPVINPVLNVCETEFTLSVLFKDILENDLGMKKALDDLKQASIPKHIFFSFHFVLTGGSNIAGFFYFGKF